MHNVIAAYPDGSPIRFVILAFECEYQSGELKVSDESTDVRCFPVDNLPSNMELCDLPAISDAMENRFQSFVR